MINWVITRSAVLPHEESIAVRISAVVRGSIAICASPVTATSESTSPNEKATWNRTCGLLSTANLTSRVTKVGCCFRNGSDNLTAWARTRGCLSLRPVMMLVAVKACSPSSAYSVCIRPKGFSHVIKKSCRAGTTDLSCCSHNNR